MIESPERLILAADGGGVRTDVALTDGRGEVLAMEVFGPTNPNRTDGLHPEGVLWEAQEVLLAAAGLEGRKIDVAVFGLAGVDNAEQARDLRGTFYKRGIARTIFLGSDAMLPLGMLPSERGIAVVAGTGSIGIGNDGNGKLLRAGGNGPGFDPGSGQEIGNTGLYDAARYWDHRLAPTKSSDIFCREVLSAAQDGVQDMLDKGDIRVPAQVENASAFIDRKLSLGMGDLYQTLHQMGTSVMAKLCNQVTPAVLTMASWSEGNGENTRPAIPEAYKIADECASRLSEHVGALSRRLIMPEVPLVMTGSTLVKSEFYRRLFLAHVSAIPGVQLQGEPITLERPIDGAIARGVKLLADVNSHAARRV